jgi:hypothetical protein
VNETELMFAGLVMLPALVILGGFTMLGLAMMRGGRQAEFRHRERMAMIERGMVPPDPVLGDARLRGSHRFKMTAGIMLCGVGMAMGMLIAFAAGEFGVAAGVGGAFVMVGLAFIAAAVNSKGEVDDSRDLLDDLRNSGRPLPASPPQPPTPPSSDAPLA